MNSQEIIERNGVYLSLPLKKGMRGHFDDFECRKLGICNQKSGLSHTKVGV